jgi:hypothetical protein
MLLPKGSWMWVGPGKVISYFDFDNAASGLLLSHHNRRYIQPFPSLPLLFSCRACWIVRAWLIFCFSFLAATSCSGRRPNIYIWSGTTSTQQQTT